MYIYTYTQYIYVPTYVRPTKGRQAQSRVGSNPIDRQRFKILSVENWTIDFPSQIATDFRFDTLYV